MSLITQLNLLESAGLLRLASAHPELEYLFRHALVQDAAYDSLLKRDRKQLHLAVGLALERLYPEQRDELAATLAYHFEKAESREKAIHYLTRAADRARNGYANTEAVTFYRAAIKQIDHILDDAQTQPGQWREQLAELYESIADVLELTGQHEAARNAYDQALAAMSELRQPTPLGQARINRKLGFAYTMSGQHAEAQQAWDRGEQMLGVEPTEQADDWWQEWIETQVERSWNFYWRGETEKMERLCEKMMPAMERYGTAVQRARVITVLYLARLQRDRWLPSDETHALAQEALTAALATGKLNLIFDGHFGLGISHLCRLELDQAEGLLNISLEGAERTGDAVRKSRSVTYLMQLARMRGEVSEARNFIPRVLEMAWAGRMTNYTFTAKACLAWIAWREGNLAEAREQARASLELLQGPLANYPNKWMALLPLLAVALTEQNLPEAIECAKLILHPTQVRFPDPLTGALEAAVAADERNQMEDVRAHLQGAISLAQEMGYL